MITELCYNYKTLFQLQIFFQLGPYITLLQLQNIVAITKQCYKIHCYTFKNLLQFQNIVTNFKALLHFQNIVTK